MSRVDSERSGMSGSTIGGELPQRTYLAELRVPNVLQLLEMLLRGLHVMAGDFGNYLRLCETLDA